MNKELLNKIANSPAEFRKAINIDADGQAVPFKPDAWQEKDFAAMDDGWKLVAGRYVEPKRSTLGKIADFVTGNHKPKLRAWLERPRGHSKTADIAISVTWALLFAIRPIRGIAAAADADQAGLLRDSIATLVRVNGWMSELLDVQRKTVVNKKSGAQLDILSSDAPSSFGQLPDFVVLDEISHWEEKAGEQLWGSLFSSAAKRKICALVALMNSGFTETFSYRVRETIRTDPAWHFSHLEGPQASWITEERLDEQRRLLPPAVFNRLWLNEWTSGSGDALTEADIRRAINAKLEPMTEREPGFAYFAGLDLSISRDHSALIVIARNLTTGRLRLAFSRRWKPPSGGKVDLLEVQRTVVEVYRRFYPKMNVDPYQAELLVQQLSKDHGIYALDFVPFVASALAEMASSVIETFQDGTIELFDDKELIADLRRLRLKESTAGWRLDAPRTAQGHCDSATALALALLAARRCPHYGRPSVPDPEMLAKLDQEIQASKKGKDDPFDGEQGWERADGGDEDETPTGLWSRFLNRHRGNRSSSRRFFR
jgi:phage terminase large subunit-like protein